MTREAKRPETDLGRACLFLVLFWTSKKVRKRTNTSKLQISSYGRDDNVARLDWVEPDSKDWANAFDCSHIVTGKGPYRWQVGPYVTWWQSPYVRVRLEVDYGDGRHTGPGELFIGLQIVFAAGPHKHERY